MIVAQLQSAGPIEILHTINTETKRRRQRSRRGKVKLRIKYMVLRTTGLHCRCVPKSSSERRLHLSVGSMKITFELMSDTDRYLIALSNSTSQRLSIFEQRVRKVYGYGWVD